jgi:hypothetical protein
LEILNIGIFWNSLEMNSPSSDPGLLQIIPPILGKATIIISSSGRKQLLTADN